MKVMNLIANLVIIRNFIHVQKNKVLFSVSSLFQSSNSRSMFFIRKEKFCLKILLKHHELSSEYILSPAKYSMQVIFDDNFTLFFFHFGHLALQKQYLNYKIRDYHNYLSILPNHINH